MHVYITHASRPHNLNHAMVGRLLRLSCSVL
jgi:hypothetical protein